jgi:hypothetical protein
MPATATASPSSVTLGSSAASVTIPDSFTLTATANETLAGYRIYIIDDDGRDSFGYCDTGTACTRTVNTSWSDNANPQPRHFHAELRTSSGSVIDRSATITVTVARFEFSITLTSPHASVTIPDSIPLTATTDRTVSATGYRIYVIDDDGRQSFGYCDTGTFAADPERRAGQRTSTPRHATFTPKCATAPEMSLAEPTSLRLPCVRSASR